MGALHRGSAAAAVRLRTQAHAQKNRPTQPGATTHAGVENAQLDYSEYADYDSGAAQDAAAPEAGEMRGAGVAPQQLVPLFPTGVDAAAMQPGQVESAVPPPTAVGEVVVPGGPVATAVPGAQGPNVTSGAGVASPPLSSPVQLPTGGGPQQASTEGSPEGSPSSAARRPAGGAAAGAAMLLLALA